MASNGKRPTPAVTIRVDASVEIGSGHVKRCLALADALAAGGASVSFACRRLDEMAPRLLSRHAYKVHWLDRPTARPRLGVRDLPAHAGWAGVSWETDVAETSACVREDDPDWLIVDHYAFDYRWHSSMRAALRCQIAVIDDLGDRALQCEVVVDQNWHADHAEKYAGRIPARTSILGGPEYALLDAAYRKATPHVHRATVRSIGIFMGGADRHNHTEIALEACTRASELEAELEVVTTSSNPHIERLRSLVAGRKGARLLVDLAELSSFFARHDIQLGTGSSATWERCCMGAPSICLVVAENQRHVVGGLGKLGIVRAILDPSIGPGELGDEIRLLAGRPELRRDMSEKSRKLVDGMGTMRVARELIGRC